MRPRFTLTILSGIFVLTAFSGCAYMANMMRGVAEHIELKQDLADIRQETRERYKEEERQAAREAALQAQIEEDLCQANKEAVRQRVQEQLRDVVNSKVAFNVSQSMDVGELEVDVEALKELLKERERPRPTQPFQERPTQKGPFQKGSLQKAECHCAEQECGCQPGLLKKFCPLCKHKKCGCEKGCGGPEAFRELARAPVRQPIRPQEIPLKLPVRLRFGMARPEVQETRVRREPVQQPGRAPFRGKKGESGFEGDSNAEPPPPIPVAEPELDESTAMFPADGDTRLLRNTPRPSGHVTPTGFAMPKREPSFVGELGYAASRYD